MKIPIQEKIAELERRIQTLEAKAASRSVLHREYVSQTQGDTPFGRHWQNIWKEFDAVIKAAFGKAH